ncbi:hypothetical protein P3W45_000223 [Vairimorpha bombi]|jgi:syntaxin 1B/2/3
MREFLKTSKKYFEDVNLLRSYTASFEHMSSQKNNGILDDKSEKMINNQIEVINNRFRKLSNELKDRLSESTTSVANENGNTKNFELKTKKIHLHAQTKALANAINEYRDAQYKHKKEEEEKFKLQYVIAKPGANEKELDECISEDKGEAQLASAFALGANSAKGILEEAEKRKTNIKKIATMIQELIEMMRILNEAIHKQTDVVDKISEDLTTAHENTVAANIDLEQALDYQIRASRIKRIIVGIIVVIVVVSIIYVILNLGIFNNSSGNVETKFVYQYK